MRIVIDLQGAQGVNRRRGVGRYTVALVDALIERATSHDVILLLNGALHESAIALRQHFASSIAPERIVTWHPPSPLEGFGRVPDAVRRSAEALREEVLASLAPDFVLVTSLFEGQSDAAVVSVGRTRHHLRTAVVLYDLIPLRMRSHYLGDAPTEVWYERQLDNLHRADLVMAISEASRRDAIEILGLDEATVVDIRAAVDRRFTKDGPGRPWADVANRLDVDRPFVMYTGGIDARKNVETLIDAFARLQPDVRDAHQLVIVCAVQNATRQALLQRGRDAGIPDGRLVLTGHVDDDDLLTLYRACHAFVFPSLLEGFGLPVLEAMACGAPVIAANTSSLPQVVGDDDALFDPGDSSAITAALQRILTDESFRHQRVERGIEQASTFSWADTADRAIASMEAATASPSPSTPDRELPSMAYVSPLPPLQSGISDYGVVMVRALSAHYRIDVVSTAPCTDPWVIANCRQWTVEEFRRQHHHFDRIVYHLGNSEFHGHMFELMRQAPGVLVLHDFYVSGLIAHLDFLGIAPGFFTQELQYAHGHPAALERFAVTDVADAIWKYPVNLRPIQDSLGVVVHSETPRRMADEWYGAHAGDDWAVVPMPREKPMRVDREAARRRLGLTDSDVLVCSFGVLGPSKQSERLVRAWLQSSLASEPRCHLAMVGDATHPAVQALITELGDGPGMERIHFTGRTSTTEYEAHLHAADIAVQLRSLSRGETSASALDAMNHGIATIVNANGSMAELPMDCVCQLPDEFVDADLTGAIEVLVSDPDRRADLGRRARDHVEAHHRPGSAASAMAAAIERFARRPHTWRPKAVESVGAISIGELDPGRRVEMARAITRTFPPRPRTPVLFVDVSELAISDARSGIQRVTRNIVRQLLREPPVGFRVEPVAATQHESYRYARSYALRTMGVDATLVDDGIEFAAGDIFLGLDLAPHVIPAQQDLLQHMRASGVALAFVVYDVLPIIRPEFFFPDAAGAHMAWFRAAASSDALIAISKSVADDVRSLLPTVPKDRYERHPRVTSFRLGADLDGEEPAHHAVPSDRGDAVLLAVGTVEPRKGHQQLVDAVLALRAAGTLVELVIVGRQGWMVESLAERLRQLSSDETSGVSWIEEATDDKLRHLYRTAAGLVVASEAEGFGLPLVEAGHFGLPLLVRDIPVFREVAGEHASYFSGNDPAALASHLKIWLTEIGAGRAPESHGIKQTSWRDSRVELVDALFASLEISSRES